MFLGAWYIYMHVCLWPLCLTWWGSSWININDTGLPFPGISSRGCAWHHYQEISKSVSDRMGKRFPIWTLRLDCIAVVKLTSAGATWFLVAPKLSRKIWLFKSELPDYVQQHKVSGSPVPLGTLQECSFFVVRFSVCHWPCNISSVLWPFTGEK